MSFKISKYTICYNFGSFLIMWNTYTNTRIKLVFSDRNRKSDFNILDIELIEKNAPIRNFLLEKKFFVEEDNEPQIIVNERIQEMLKDKSLQLKLFIGERCNFRCSYCWQTHDSTYDMPGTVYDKISSLLREKAADYNSLSIDWIGGEPLLYIDDIIKYSTKWIEISKKHKKQYTAAITTNGYYLTPEVAKKLQKCKILVYQVTLDGCKDVHNKTRNTSNNFLDTYSTIKENLELIACDKALRHLQFIIRLNITRDILDNQEKVIQSMKELKFNSNFKFYLVPVWDTNLDTYGITLIEYLKFMNVCLESNLNVSSLLSNPGTSIICPYINQFTYNINYLGDIKKCLGYPSISNLDQISDSANSTIIHGSPWWKIKERTECEDCSAYPICLNLICPHKELCLKELFFAKEMGLCLDINKEWEL